MAYTKAQLEALKNSLIASAQPTKITGVKHRQAYQAILDELFDAQSRANQLKDVGTSAAAQGGDTFIVIRLGVAYLVPLTVFSIDRVALTTSGSTITMNMGGLRERMFAGSSVIGAVKTWAFSNDSNMIKAIVNFELSTTDVQTFPATVIMQTLTGIWNTSAKEWTPDVVGKYQMEITYDNTNHHVKLFGPFE